MILIDFREPKQILNYFQNFKVCKLNYDYLIKDIAVERKTFTDFLQSLYQGKLFNQLLRTKKEYEKTILVVEGLIDPNFLTNPKIFYSTLQFITINLNIPVIFSQSLENTAEVIKKLNENKINFFSVSKIKISPKKENVQERMLQCIEGIGKKRARAIIKKYESIEKIINLKNNTIKGIDRKIIKKNQYDIKILKNYLMIKNNTT